MSDSFEENPDSLKQVECRLTDSLAQLRFDESLLGACDSLELGPTIRFWQASELGVVLGYSNVPEAEIRVDRCLADGVRVFRRASGGGTVLLGPGCLNYSLILPMSGSAALASVKKTNEYVMNRHRDAIAKLVSDPIGVRGFTDLTLGGKKFSGNAQRRRRQALLFHGTFLLDFSLPLMERYLLMPSRQPEYRQDRTHSDFTTNLGRSSAVVRRALEERWGVAGSVPSREVEHLADRLDEAGYRSREIILGV